MTSSAEPAVELIGLRKTFGSFVALAQIDLQVERGRVFGLLGPNGAGKTTTLRLITGLLEPTAGVIRICGFDRLRQPLEAKRRIGFISDRPHVYDKLTGAEFLRFVGGLWGMTPQAIRRESERWLRRFDLEGWAGESVEAYSHGMRQRLLLCSALLHGPELLIMDEPMVGLDPRGAARLKEVVAEVAAGGMAVVLSTHTLEVVEQICDEVAIVDKGRVIASGTLEQLRARHGGAAARSGSGDRLERLFLQLTASEEDNA